MPSKALDGLLRGVGEVDHLLEGDPTPIGGLSPRPDITRAVTRAAVVLLCSHYERYLRSVVEETVAEVNARGVVGDRLSERLRLQHSRMGVEELATLEWTRRANRLGEFIRSEAWLWGGGPQSPLSAKALLSWMRAPVPKNVIRLYDLWGISDIFSNITRAEHTRRNLELNLQALVDKRNNIAHGDFSVEATRGDVERYQGAVSIFCERADRALAKALNRSLGMVVGWYRSVPSRW